MRSPTLLMVFLHPDKEGQALSLLNEIPSCAGFTVIGMAQDTLASPLAEPFTIFYTEKRLSLALSNALTPEALKELAELVATGLLSGFIVQGEINLGECTFNNLHRQVLHPSPAVEA